MSHSGKLGYHIRYSQSRIYKFHPICCVPNFLHSLELNLVPWKRKKVWWESSWGCLSMHHAISFGIPEHRWSFRWKNIWKTWEYVEEMLLLLMDKSFFQLYGITSFVAEQRFQAISTGTIVFKMINVTIYQLWKLILHLSSYHVKLP